MPGGGATISTNQKREPNGPPFPANSAFNGLSVDTTTGQIVLGNDFTDPAQLAKFVSFREVDMNGFNIFWDIWGNFGAGPSPEYFSYGQNPFVGINGATLGINYGAWPPAVNGLMGWYMNEYVVGSVGAFVRGPNNDSWMIGEFYNGFGSVLAPTSRINFFDSGNITVNSQNGTYPQSQDVDTGNGFMIFNVNGFSVAPDITFAQQLQYINSILAVHRIGADFSVGASKILLDNSNSAFQMLGTLGTGFSPALPLTDIAVLEFTSGVIVDTSLVFASDGSIIVAGVADKPLITNSGNQWQVYGNIETKPSASGSSGSMFNGSMQTNVAGSTSGNAIFSQPEQGASYKKVVIFLNALVGTASFNFPTSFVNTPQIMTTDGPPAAIVTTLTNLIVIVTGANTTGFIFLEGF